MEQNPSLYLAKPVKDTEFFLLVQLYKKLMGREPTVDELAEAKAMLEQHRSRT